MLHTKFRENRPAGSRQEDFLVVFTIYGLGGHLGHVTKISRTKLQCHYQKEAPHKISTRLAKRFQRRSSLKLWKTDRRTTDGWTDARSWPSYKLTL